MNTPELPGPDGQVDLEALFARIDQHPHRSDPNGEMEAYFQLVKVGEAALASLFAAGKTMSPWQLRAIIDITRNMPDPIKLPLSGEPYGDFLDAVLSWGEQNGYIAAEPSSE